MNLHDEKILRLQLTFVYRVIIASEELLREAIVNMTFEDDFDDELHLFYEKHRREEREHAEWLLEDLNGLVTTDIDWTAACVAGTQYYLIKHVHPALLLGYMQALEVPVPISMIEELENIHGKSLLRTWRHHAEVDGEHAKEIEKMIAIAPAYLQEKIEQNRQATIQLWNSTLTRYQDA
jgi:hypothetical protein